MNNIRDQFRYYKSCILEKAWENSFKTSKWFSLISVSGIMVLHLVFTHFLNHIITVSRTLGVNDLGRGSCPRFLQNLAGINVKQY